MVNYIDNNYDVEAIEKCSNALVKLDDKTKIRVIKYLLDKFGLIAESEAQTREVVNQNIQYQQNNLVLTEPKKMQLSSGSTAFLNSSNFISLKDILIKNLTKTEPELLVVIGYYNSNFGKESFTRQSILDSLKDNNIMSESRRGNLTKNLQSLIKNSYIKSITNDDFSVTQEGCEYANNILNGNSTTKQRKPRLKKGKKGKQTDNEEINE